MLLLEDHSSFSSQSQHEPVADNCQQSPYMYSTVNSHNHTVIHHNSRAQTQTTTPPPSPLPYKRLQRLGSADPRAPAAATSPTSNTPAIPHTQTQNTRTPSHASKHPRNSPGAAHVGIGVEVTDVARLGPGPRQVEMIQLRHRCDCATLWD